MLKEPYVQYNSSNFHKITKMAGKLTNACKNSMLRRQCCSALAFLDGYILCKLLSVRECDTKSIGAVK